MNYAEIMEKRNSLMSVMHLTLPRKVSVAIVKNLSLFNSEIDFYNSQRNDIADRYAQKDKSGNYILEGNQYTFATMGDREDFLQEARELNETNVDIEKNIMKFYASELDKCDDSDRYNVLTPAQEISLGWMIDYNEE